MKQKVKGKEHITAKEWASWINLYGDNFRFNRSARSRAIEIREHLFYRFAEYFSDG